MELSRFSTKVKASSTKRPEGVSRREGMWLLIFAALIVLFVWARLLAGLTPGKWTRRGLAMLL